MERWRALENTPEFFLSGVPRVFAESRLELLLQSFDLLKKVIADEADWTRHWEFTP
jgi:hypothetical protein